MGMRGLRVRANTPPDGDAGATCKNRNVGSNKIYVPGVSECLRLRGQHTTPHGDAGATSKNRNVGSNKIYVPGVSECLRLRGQHPQHGDAGATRLDTVTQECGSNTQLCSQGIPMPGNARTTHPDGDVEATCKNRNVGRVNIYVSRASQCLRLRGQHPPAWGCGGGV